MKLIMRNEANFQKSQMFITVISTMNYSEKMKLDTWSKQTQTKPILVRHSFSDGGLPAPLFRVSFTLMGTASGQIVCSQRKVIDSAGENGRIVKVFYAYSFRTI